jgi:2-polyprenyl-6-methoxyphenol hydroxylase-like FAD-dependent oxidoreductase
MTRHAEIAGAGFGGLVAAVALAQRGWSVRVHERSASLRAEGFGIAMQPNMAKVFEALGILEPVLAGGLRIMRRETRNHRNVPTMVARAPGGWGHRISRQHMIAVLADHACALGVDIVSGSAITGARPDGTLLLEDGTERRADLVIGADGINSKVLYSLDLLRSRRLLPDGAFRVMIPRTADEAAEDGIEGPLTVEHWSGHRRVIMSPCSPSELYCALSCLAQDHTGRATPINSESWSQSFPHLTLLFARIARDAHWERVQWVQFQTIRLHRWSRGRAAVVGDAAHAMPPNLGQGGGCAMMNALALAVALNGSPNIEDALQQWERAERPLTEHTQRWSSIYGHLTVWPQGLRSLAFRALGEIKWLRDRYQRTARHIPTGFATAAPRTDQISLGSDRHRAQ